jgi:hypothetical protein
MMTKSSVLCRFTYVLCILRWLKSPIWAKKESWNNELMKERQCQYVQKWSRVKGRFLFDGNLVIESHYHEIQALLWDLRNTIWIEWLKLSMWELNREPFHLVADVLTSKPQSSSFFANFQFYIRGFQTRSGPHHQVSGCKYIYICGLKKHFFGDFFRSGQNWEWYSSVQESVLLLSWWCASWTTVRDHLFACNWLVE